ncbi:uncharacterized protein LOC122248182 isoform X2 [Penaeus japonicus]|uniref:uncharacterized protein LOC122248182 isoform X2 n=1 Tax=Penaeus japonicus TaxID=27405 RepID=UPI001C70F1AB|nr:uncharacterized protein LOC122248182 isoform X2 [Penaeus japonicus]
MAILHLVWMAVVLAHGAVSDCPPGEVACADASQCINTYYICDGGGNDCPDGSDEEKGLCLAWGTGMCGMGHVTCKDGGSVSCYSVPYYCQFPQPPCESDLDMRVCEILENGELRALSSVANEETSKVGFEVVEMLYDLFLQQVNGTLDHPNCKFPYTLIEGQCISIFFPAKVDWGAARAFCSVIGGELLVLQQYDLFLALTRRLQEIDMVTDFWLGGYMENETIGWTWVNDAPVELGTPFWALRYTEECQPREIAIHGNLTLPANEGQCYHYTQAPGSPPLGHCLALTYGKFFYMSDEMCLEKRSPLCVATPL